MKKLFKIIPLPAAMALLFSCVNCPQQIEIGSQTWASKNLNVSIFRNGDTILEAQTDSEWKAAGDHKQAAWCYYNNDPVNGKKYGKLYNWYAVNDSRGLAPSGWHVPSDAEWKTMTDYLGGAEVAGTKLKSTSGWEDNGNGTNTTCFSALPGGYRYLNGQFDDIGGIGFWWSASEYVESFAAYYRIMIYNYGKVQSIWYSKENGFSVRCISD